MLRSFPLRMPTKQLEGTISNELVFRVWMVCPYVMVELDLCNECTKFVGYAHNFIYIKGLRYKDQWNKQSGFSFSCFLLSVFRSSLSSTAYVSNLQAKKNSEKILGECRLQVFSFPARFTLIDIRFGKYENHKTIHLRCLESGIVSVEQRFRLS